MSTAPFTTACWALGIACLVSILTVVPAALGTHRSSSAVIVQRLAPAPQVVPNDKPLPSVEREPHHDHPPLRIATANLDAPLGLQGSGPFAPQVKPIIPATPRGAAQEDLSIRVPDPVERQPGSNGIFAAPVVPAPVAPPARKMFTAQDFAKLGLSLGKEDEQALRGYLAKNGVTATRQGRSWSYRFDDAPVDIVLTLLASHAENSILISQNVEGTFSGMFDALDPMQCFVLVIKSQHLRLDRRGSSLLVLPPPAQLSAAR